MTTGLEHESLSNVIKVFQAVAATLKNRVSGKFGETTNDDTKRLAGRMRLDRPDCQCVPSRLVRLCFVETH
jgi:hypothetical protein